MATIHPPELQPVFDRLEQYGVTVVEAPHYINVVTDGAEIVIQARPSYCDRGRFICQVAPTGKFALEFDWADSFPRYYFGAGACADEIYAWLVARKLIVPSVWECPECHRQFNTPGSCWGGGGEGKSYIGVHGATNTERVT